MKKVTALLLICVLLLISPGAVSAKSVFPDVSDSAWYAEYVSKAVSSGMVEGYPDGSFKPEKLLKYAEFIAMMVEQQTTDEKVSQIDTGHWGIPYYNMGLKLGYYSEVEIPAAKLNDPIPRRDMALIAAGYLLKNADLPEKVEHKAYPDVPYEDEDEYYISLCSALKVLEGYDDGSFKPEKTLKRSEAVKVAVCCMELKEKKESGTGTQPVPGGQDPQASERPTGSGPNGWPTAWEFSDELVTSGKDAEADYITQNIESILDPERKAILDEILASVRITKEGGKFYFSYSQPQIPEEWENHIHLSIYNIKGKGVFGYDNQTGVGIHPEYWHEIRKKQNVKVEITGIGGTLEDKAISLRLSMSEVEPSWAFGSFTYQLIKDIPEDIITGDIFRISTSFSGDSFIQETPLDHEGFMSWK
ncbi:MAG: S-layer homology domain-containing protein [Lachnospiraceae bacterium]|nr:S-layer homology domain-containing protein [Lachnospiraceae bacterium]